MKTILALLVIAVAVAEINGEMMQRFGGVRRCSNKPTCAKGQKVKSYVIEGTTCPETEPIQQRGVRKQKVCQNGETPFSKLCAYCVDRKTKSVVSTKTCDVSCDPSNGRKVVCGCQESGADDATVEA